MTTPNYEFEARLFRTAHEQLQAEIDRLKAALKKHGRHTDNCLIEMAFSYDHLDTEECICGLEEALKERSHERPMGTIDSMYRVR